MYECLSSHLSVFKPKLPSFTKLLSGYLNCPFLFLTKVPFVIMTSVQVMHNPSLLVRAEPSLGPETMLRRWHKKKSSKTKLANLILVLVFLLLMQLLAGMLWMLLPKLRQTPVGSPAADLQSWSHLEARWCQIHLQKLLWIGTQPCAIYAGWWLFQHAVD